jgi:hypothetical protein
MATRNVAGDLRRVGDLAEPMRSGDKGEKILAISRGIHSPGHEARGSDFAGGEIRRHRDREPRQGTDKCVGSVRWALQLNAPGRVR